MPNKPVIGVLIAAALLVSGIWLQNTKHLRMAPAVTFKTIQAQALELLAFKGQPVLVTFWATDCPSCLEEIPHLIKLHETYHARGFRLIAVNMYYDPPNRVLAMVKSKQLPYSIALDPNGELADAFGDVKLTPTTFLIDKSGKIILQTQGKFEPAYLQQQIELLLTDQ